MEEQETEAAPDAAAAAADSAEENTESDDVLDVINESLADLVAKAQEKVDAATEVVAKKREELEALEAEAEKKAEQMDVLREQAQAVADDEQWMSMYQRLRVWSKEQGHCNPRRNWKSKIDVEEKALGNWSGKQRREEKQDELNPFKKAALERIGFTFDPKQQKWEVFHSKLKHFLSKHGQIPENLNDDKVKLSGIQRQLFYHQKLPKQILGEYKDSRNKDTATGESIKKEMPNDHFTQDRIDILTEAGLNWNLSTDQVNALKEKGLKFQLPTYEPRPMNGDMVGLEQHSWLTMFEALVEFKREHGHTFVTSFNSSEELDHWVKEQRKKMKSLGTPKGKKDKPFCEYQAEMLSGIDFVHRKPDVEWMENYERLVAFGRLFGVAAVTDKFCSFEILQQWLDENKRLHLNLPQLASHTKMSWALPSGNVTIPLPERKKLLADIGVFDVPVGEEEVEARKSNFFFRTAEQVKGWDQGVLKSLREKRKAAISMMANSSIQQQQGTVPPAETDASSSSQSLHERCRQAAIGNIVKSKFCPEKERCFFLKRGAIVAATVAERERIASSVTNKFFGDGRNTGLCRISNCYGKSSRSNQYLCTRHFHMIEIAARCDPSLLAASHRADSNEESASDEAKSGEGDTSNFNEEYCGPVEEATTIPASTNLPSHPPWTKVPMPSHLTGEAKVLAEHYRHMVWKVTSDYRRILAEQPKKNDNKYISAALGEHARASLKPDEEIFHLPSVKFPSEEAELESIKLFRRCAGPLAATLSGRKKLIRNGKILYGDARPLRYCRVAGCQMVHSESESWRYLCDWHRAMIESVQLKTMSEIGSAGKRKRDQTNSKTPEENATMKASKAAAAMKRNLSSDPGSLKTLKTSADFYAKLKSKTAAGTKDGLLSDPRKQMLAPAPVPNAMFPPNAAYASAIKPAATTMAFAAPCTAMLPPTKDPHKYLGKSTTVAAAMKPAATADTDMKVGAPVQNTNPANDSSKSRKNVETPLEPADADISQFMGC